MDATRELIDLCHIGSGRRVLDVGCGVGATPVYLAKTMVCTIFAVDLLESMIQQVRDRVRRQGVGDSVAAAVADARDLPFPDGHFDAVIMESLNVFFDDKVGAVREYARVTRPGGYVGMTEMTWLAPPSQEKSDYYRRTVYADALQAEGWKALLEEAGLEDVVGSARSADIPREAKGRIQRYGCLGYVRILAKAVSVFFGDRASRAFLTDVTRTVPQDMLEDIGYGVYAGRKP